MASAQRPKAWTFPIVITEHAYDELIAIDLTYSEFEYLLRTSAEVIEDIEVDHRSTKEVILYLHWIRPLHVVVLVDRHRREERVVTVYEPTTNRWSHDFRRRKR
ncbi:MAG: DUF4258 domain-containing protein [Microthrixaceae bacterium]